MTDKTARLFHDRTGRLRHSDFRRTGLLTGPSKLRKFEREFSDHVQNHDGYLRTVEDAVLFEMARRFYNQVIF